MTRAMNGEIEAQCGCLPQVQTQEHLGDDGEAVEPRVDGDGLRLRKNALVSVDRANQGGKRHTEGRPE
jgi:hypothetical protein